MLILIWNDRKRFAGIFIEQILVFIVCMLCLVSIAFAIYEYNKPGILDTENVISVGYSVINKNAGNLNDISRDFDQLLEKLRRNPNVKAISREDNFTPYIRGDSHKLDSITIDHIQLKVYTKWADRYTKSVYNIELIEGEWLTDETLADGSEGIVITQNIANTLKWQKAVGRKMLVCNRNYTVVGVIKGFRHTVSRPSSATVIMPISSRNTSYREIAVKVNDLELFTNDFYVEWNRTMKNRGLALTFDYLDKLRKSDVISEITDIVLQTIPTVFLIIFAFIGTFGIFWLNLKKRSKEFALRIVVGSTPSQLMWYVVKESVIITSISMLPGLLLTVFIYEFTIVHLLAIGISIMLMLVFAIFSAWYPAYKVSQVNPVDAMRE
ncbi:ABC transporter permease [Butyricimonas paravirosa]